MAWEWAPPLATVVVGVAGVTGTWLAGRNQGKIAIESAKIGTNSTQQLAREERNQRRIESAYRSLDENLSVVEALLGRLVPSATRGPTLAIDEIPRNFLKSSILAPLSADKLYHSPRVREIMEEFDSEFALLQGFLTTINLLGSHLRDDVERMQALESDIISRSEGALRAIAQVRFQMSAELRGEASGQNNRGESA